jgi:hypothetical protein
VLAELSDLEKQCIEVTERFADNEVDITEVVTARSRAVDAALAESRARIAALHLLVNPVLGSSSRAVERSASQDFDSATDPARVSLSVSEAVATRIATDLPENYDWAARLETEKRASQAVHCSLLRCLFGNPFRPPPVVPDHVRTKTVIALVTAIYDERAFERTPVLADAAEEAGLTDAMVLSHLRDLGPHARGCHALDLLLMKGLTP